MFTLLEEKRLVTAGSMLADITSTDFNTLTIVSFTIACVATSGTPVGDLELEIEMEEGSGTFFPHTITGITAAGTTIFEILDPSGFRYRIFFDFTSGTGTLDVFLAARVHKRGGDPAGEVL